MRTSFAWFMAKSAKEICPDAALRSWSRSGWGEIKYALQIGVSGTNGNMGTTQLMTMNGSGGCGTTHLDVQVATDLLDAISNGI